MKWSRSCESLTRCAGARHTSRVNETVQTSVWKVCACLPWLRCGLMRYPRSTWGHSMNGWGTTGVGWGFPSEELTKSISSKGPLMFEGTLACTERHFIQFNVEYFTFYFEWSQNNLLFKYIHFSVNTQNSLYLNVFPMSIFFSDQKYNFGCCFTNIHPR